MMQVPRTKRAPESPCAAGPHLIDLFLAIISGDSQGVALDALVEGGREQQELYRLLRISPEIPYKPH